MDDISREIKTPSKALLQKLTGHPVNTPGALKRFIALVSDSLEGETELKKNSYIFKFTIKQKNTYNDNKIIKAIKANPWFGVYWYLSRADGLHVFHISHADMGETKGLRNVFL